MYYEKPLNESIIYRSSEKLVVLVFNGEDLIHTSKIVGGMKIYYGAKKEIIQAEVPLFEDLNKVIKELPISEEGVNTIYSLRKHPNS